MNKFVKLYIEKYYKQLSEGINFSDLDDSSDDTNDMVFSNVLLKTSLLALLKKYTDMLNSIDINDNYTEIFKKLYEDYKKIQFPLYKVVDKDTLEAIIMLHIDTYGDKCDLNWIDTSQIMDMSFLFHNTVFNGDISKWDVSNVKNMQSMFHASNFNGNINGWDVSNVENMACIFAYNYKFNQPISDWDVSNVLDMMAMFTSAKSFDQDISGWNISNVTNFDWIFTDCPIKQNHIFKKWQPLTLTEGINFNDLDDSSDDTEFNNILNDLSLYIAKKQLTNKLNNEYLTNYSNNSSYRKEFEKIQTLYKKLQIPIYIASDDIFYDIIYHHIKLYGNRCDLNWIDTSQITDMSYLFYDSDSKVSDFNGDISKWDVSNVTNMENMFAESKFNGDISKWDVSNVTNMSGMFAETNFNLDISRWNVSNVTEMEDIFNECSIKEKYKPKFNK